MRLEPLFREKAKESHDKNGGDKKSEFAKSASLISGKPILQVDKELAKIAGASHSIIHNVRVIEKEATPEQKEQLSKGVTKISNVYKQLRPKEVSEVIQNNIEPIIKKEENKKVAIPEESQPHEIPDIFSIAYFESLVNGFLAQINPLSFSKMLIQNMDTETKNQYIKHLDSTSKWIERIKKNINENMGE